MRIRFFRRAARACCELRSAAGGRDPRRRHRRFRTPGLPIWGGPPAVERVRRLRGCSYFSGTHDFNIVTGGLVVFPRLVARVHAEIPTFEPLTSGLVQIDGLLGGGLPRGSCTLVMGPAGSGKSTIATVFAMAAAKRRRALFHTTF